jgi:uncharacterized protein YndB with AHSA1/START domain
MSTKHRPAGGSSKQELVLTRTFDAPRELVFKVWTDPKHVAQWWGPAGFTNPVCELEARSGGAIRIHMRAPDGTVYPMTGVYQEFVAPERLVFTSSALDGAGQPMFEILTTVTFAEQAGKTTQVLRARVTKKTDGADVYLDGMEAGWTQSLERLAGYLAAKSGPLVIERTVDASAARVWQALTTKEDFDRWYFKIKEFRPEVGFEFQFYGENEGVKYDHRCKITEVVPGKKLAYSWRYEGHEGDSLVTFELFAEGGKTRLRLTHAGLETFPRTPAFARGNFVEGWTELIGTSLKQFVETSNGK